MNDRRLDSHLYASLTKEGRGSSIPRKIRHARAISCTSALRCTSTWTRRRPASPTCTYFRSREAQEPLRNARAYEGGAAIHVLKRILGFTKVHFRGLKTNHRKLCAALAMINVYLHCRRLVAHVELPSKGRSVQAGSSRYLWRAKRAFLPLQSAAFAPTRCNSCNRLL